LVELRAGALGVLGANSLEEVEGFTHASALVSPVFADEHAHGDLCRRVIDSALFANAAAEFDAFTII
jgi:hypothetical protein